MYKAQRAPTPPAVTEGARQVHDLIRVMGIPEIIIPGVEADDAIGTLAMRGIREGFQVAIASPDKVRAAVITGCMYSSLFVCLFSHVLNHLLIGACYHLFTHSHLLACNHSTPYTLGCGASCDSLDFLA